MHKFIMTSCSWIVVAAALCLSVSPAPASPKNAPEHWVTTWATAQQLMPGGPGRGGRGPAPAPANGAPSGPAAPPNAPAPQAAVPSPPAANANPPAAPPPAQANNAPAPGRNPSPLPALPASFSDETVRMITHVSVGGKRVRIELSNMLTAQPVEVGAAHIALRKEGGSIIDGTDRALTFGGSSAVTLLPGVLTVSDPVDLDVAPLSNVAVSLYFPHDTGAPTTHLLGLHSTYVSKGNVAAAATMPDPQTLFSYAWLSSVDVLASDDAFTIVAFGDSITDGFRTTRDADNAWPALLARRLNANKPTQHIAVVNMGISGNQVLRDGAGLSALARFDRDVLSRPGVKWMILLEGINDINGRARLDGPNQLTAAELIAGYHQLIERCHAHGIKVIGATVMAEEGVPVVSEKGEAVRLAANDWIRAKGNFDAFVDLDAAVRDPQHPARIRPDFDPGDHLHPNDAGNQAMADAFDLKLFK